VAIEDSPVCPTMLAKLITRVLDNTLNNKGAKTVFAALWAKDGDDVDQLIEKLGLKQISDTGAIEKIVDEVIAYIKSSGLHCHVGPFETTIEGDDYDQLMDIVKECQHVAIRAGAEKVSAYVKVVYRPEGEILTIDKKITKHAET
jgi:uncharacterized protein YqgV (UPF0045/DUF77 family)